MSLENTIEDGLEDDEREQIAEAQERSRREKEAAERKRRRAGTKYGSMLEDE